MNRIIIGIDVGQTGAIAAITNSGKLVGVWDMPLEKYVINSKAKHRVDGAALHRILSVLDDVALCRVENVFANPTQGVSSMFSFGDAFGCVRTVVGICGFATEYISSQSWKKKRGLIGTDKDTARLQAIELFPAASLHRKKDIGRADALLIAYSGL